MPFRTEVGLVPSDIVLDGDPAPPPEKGATAPNFRPICLVWPNGWMHQDTIWHRGGPRRLDPGDILVNGDPAPPKRGTVPFGTEVGLC